MRSKSPAESQALYLPSGKYLKITSFGFPEDADLIYIWSIQYYSHQDAAERFKYLEHIYTNVISELDPLYVDPYLVGAMIMSMEANDDEMALWLLDKGIAANPDEWILAFNAGLCYDRLKDYPRAVHYFELAVESPGAQRRGAFAPRCTTRWETSARRWSTGGNPSRSAERLHPQRVLDARA